MMILRWQRVSLGNAYLVTASRATVYARVGSGVTGRVLCVVGGAIRLAEKTRELRKSGVALRDHDASARLRYGA
jgi:hypothetical protein